MQNANLTVDVSVADSLLESGDDDVPEPARLQRWAQAAYLKQTPAIVSLYIASSDEIQQMNKQYRNKDKPTNVLSFAMPADASWPELSMASPHDSCADIDDEDHQADMSLLGDIALCAEVIRQEAEQQHKPADAHWAHMVVHGMLQLQDYDHIDETEAEQMEQLETSILAKLGIADPYKDTATDTGRRT
jgi:probable rRNA maturation factor